MNSEPITQESSKRICSHMNQDHPDAVKAYAEHYCGIKNCNNAIMLSISPDSMELKVDDQNLKIKFDHILENCSDAHKKLVDMIKSIPAT